jgi:hypothetical protein
MERLNILWTSNDKETLRNMISMYSINSLGNGSWDEVNLIIWGSSTKLAGEDPDVQKEIKKMLSKGVSIEACKACADKYKLSQTLKDLGVEVKYMTKFTNYIKGDDKLITI